MPQPHAYAPVLIVGSDPSNPDTDGGGIPDGEEVFDYGTNPLDGADDATAVDSDSDGLTDAVEATLGTDPQNPDSDSDGLLDGEEVTLGTDPLSNDTDSDGVNDFDEIDFFETNATSAEADKDGDGLLDQDEILIHTTDPNKFDTDEGGASDGDEVSSGTDPLDGADDSTTDDADEDGLSLAEENENGTDPQNADTDGDGVDDGDEVNTYSVSLRRPPLRGPLCTFSHLTDEPVEQRYGLRRCQ